MIVLPVTQYKKKDKYEMMCLRLFDYWLWLDIIEDIFSESQHCGFHSLPCQFFNHTVL